MSMDRRHGNPLRGRERGMQLLEVALLLPLLLVLTAGAVDFGQAWNMRQVLANAARDGARLGASQPFSDLNNTNPTSIQQVCQQVASYLNQEHVNLAFMNNTNNSGTPSSTISGMCSTPGTIANSSCAALSTGGTCVPSAWTYYSNVTYGYGLKIERTVDVPSSGTSCAPGTGATCISSTRVTLKYPYKWGMGFNHIIGLFGAQNYPSTIAIPVDSTMSNLAETL